MNASPGRKPRRNSPRILFLRFGYFLERELMAAFALTGADVTAFWPEREAAPGAQGYVTSLLERIQAHRPDTLLSINFLGGDLEGPLMDLLNKLRLTFATWFVDSPELFLHGRSHLTSTRSVLFCCDPDARTKLEPMGFDNVHHLPLAADSTRVDLEAPIATSGTTLPVSFVGSNWVDKLGRTLCNFNFPRGLLRHYRSAGWALAQGDYQSDTLSCLQKRYPKFATAVAPLSASDRRGALHLACWEANRAYRQHCVSRLAPFNATIVGDRHWQRQLGPLASQFSLHPAIGYYTPDLPRLYRASTINFACSSTQMPGAVTQRAFDVPAAGGFLLTDRRRQMDELFEPDVESACYDTPEDIPEAVARWSKDTTRARAVTRAARKRIAAEHTYVHRVRRMIDILCAQ
ncbi:glycosyltransferase family protein [Desulfovibrio ferrophilus]|uniref:CgeB family protein n=1 Tax=Desulfovibrio ferrophilus TaxID=241368 RepID=A0A2Z6B0R4_9BACT|nr:glycosyltransferase [Desulfovibrio ferrophilus]BBD09117.1 CgeB family protein [Desulfovibrio ferrophilus]